MDDIFSFMLCSAGGRKEECNQYREELNDNLIASAVIDLISISFSSFVNVINLLYVIPYNDVKRAYQKISKQ